MNKNKANKVNKQANTRCPIRNKFCLYVEKNRANTFGVMLSQLSKPIISAIIPITTCIVTALVIISQHYHKTVNEFDLIREILMSRRRILPFYIPVDFGSGDVDLVQYIFDGKSVVP
ncbi:MAG: hypothetical protein V3U84_12585 [Thiotrichaceae bacterium]